MVPESSSPSPDVAAPKVSVALITYNHERFIAQAIDSVLMQDTAFDFELVIGEDCSTDRTREIVLSYQRKHPGIVRPLLPEKNLGMNRNFVQTMRACRGTYIALLDGDDYWTSATKLQQQVDFLDHHPGFMTCFHDVAVVSDAEIDAQKYAHRGVTDQDVYRLKDLLQRNPMPTCSVMFRNGFSKDFPESYYGLKLGDWPLHIFNAQYGDAKYLEQELGTYRVHGGGVWSGQNTTNQLQSFIAMFQCLSEFLERRYRNDLKAALARQYYHLSLAHYAAHETATARRSLVQSLRHVSPGNRQFVKTLWPLLLELYVPGVCRLVYHSKQRAKELLRRITALAA